MSKWIARGLVIGVLAAFAIIVVGYYFFARSLTDYNEASPLSYGNYTAQIQRDNFAVPHITGERDVDAFFALGFAHAQDRIWQMVDARRLVQGRLSEIHGRETLALDRFMRALDLWRVAQRNHGALTETSQARLQAYADGVNAYINEINVKKRGSGAPEFVLYSRQIAPWTPIDSVALMKLYALRSTGAAEFEIETGKLTALLDAENAAFFTDRTRLLGPTLKSLSANLSPTGYGRPLPTGSAFVANDTRTADKSPLIAVSQSGTLGAPNAWFLAHLKWGNGKADITGATIPGLPLIINGHNHQLAWGLLPSTVDDQDLVIIKTTDNPTSFSDLSGAHDIRSEKTTIGISDSTAVEFIRQSTKYGPIIPTDSDGPWAIEPLVPPGHHAALAWPGLDVEDQTIDGLFLLMEARAIDQATRAANLIHSPVSVLSVVDQTGDVANYSVGAHPVRDELHATNGTSPAPSWLGPAGFVDVVRGAQPLDVTNNGLAIVTRAQNSSALSATYGVDYYRILRANDLLGTRPFHTVTSFAEAQNDTIGADARAILPLIASEFWFQPNQSESRTEVLTLLGNWTGGFSALDPEPLIYTAWLTALNELIFADEFGANYPLFSQIDPRAIEAAFLDENGAASWCDIKPTPGLETCVELADIALDRAIQTLNQDHGSAVQNWRWGRAHPAVHINPALTHRRLIGSFADIPHPFSGGEATLQLAPANASYARDYATQFASEFRMIVDFADLKRSKYIIATGQSGHLLSPYYDDQSVLWREGGYLDMVTDQRTIDANQIGTIRFEANTGIVGN